MKKWEKISCLFLLCTSIGMASFYAASNVIQAETEEIPVVSVMPESTSAPVVTQTPQTTEIPVSSDVPVSSQVPATTAAAENKIKLALDKEKLTLQPGKSQQLTYWVESGDLSGKSITWQSSDTKVATVNEDGIVTALNAGTATITVSTENASASCIVTVSSVAVKGITLNRSYVYLNGMETFQLISTITPDNATNKSVYWSSSDTTVALVNDNGIVAGVSDGTARVTAQTVDGGYKKYCTVYITGNTITSVSLNKTTCKLGIGETEILKAALLPASVRITDVIWSSSDTTVASVDVSGKVTALKEGITRITATAVNGKKSASCLVTVSPIYAASITLDKKIAEITIGTPLTLTASILPSNTTNQEITWTTSDSSIATVSDRGIITGKAYGIAKIKAALKNISATCIIKVNGVDGSKTYETGAKYEGALGNEKRNGIGTLTKSNGTSIKGTWSNNVLLSSTAVVTFKNGDVYTGRYTGYIKSGKATYKTKSGTVIKGTWKNNKLTGSASIFYSDGDKYSGNFKNSKKNGKGTYKFANGDKYVGYWKNDKMNGSGKYTFKNGSYYKGIFKNNRLTGNGYYQTSGGTLYKGTFKNSKMTKVISKR